MGFCSIKINIMKRKQEKGNKNNQETIIENVEGKISQKYQKSIYRQDRIQSKVEIILYIL